MKNTITIFFISFILLTLSSCSEKIIYDKLPTEGFEIKENIILKKEELNVEEETLSSPEQIISDGEYLYICDCENNRILKCGLNGDSPVEIGKDELIKPKCIALNNENICVYDFGNRRIRIISKTGEFVKEYPLDNFNGLSYITDVEIDDNNSVYFSLIAFHKDIKEAGIYKASDEGHILLKKLAVSGFCKENETNDIFYILKCELKNKSEWGSGYSEIGKISGENVSTLAAVSDFYSPADTAVFDGNIYVWDNSLNSLDKFGLNGDYIETVYKEPVTGETYCGFCCDHHGSYYISAKDSNKIYKLKRG